MTFSGWTDAALDFYEGLEIDNSRAYWQSHKQVYDEEVREPMEALLAELCDRRRARPAGPPSARAPLRRRPACATASRPGSCRSPGPRRSQGRRRSSRRRSLLESGTKRLVTGDLAPWPS